MPKPPEHELAPDPISDEETVETAIIPPPAAPPPVVPPPTPDGWPAGEQVVVDDAGGRRMVTPGPPLPPAEDPRRGNWLGPTLVFGARDRARGGAAVSQRRRQERHH